MTPSNFSKQLHARQSLIFDRLLELLFATSMLDKMENLVLEPTSESPNSWRLFRLRFNQPNGSPRSYVVKTVNADEYAIHRLLSTKLSETIPEVYLGGPVGADPAAEWLLVMEDLGLGPLVRVASDETFAVCGTAPIANARFVFSFQEALRLLAIIHSHFPERRSELEMCGLRPVVIDPLVLGASVPATCSLLAVCRTLLDLPLEAQVIHEIERIGLHLSSELRPLQKDECWTLVHGDFHFGNLLLNSSGKIKIADWGLSAIQVAAWDLVLCGETEVAYYLEVAGRYVCKNIPEFFSQLRAAVICRMYIFIQSALIAIYNGKYPWLAAALPICMRRLVEAASDCNFRGGNAVRLFPWTAAHQPAGLR